MDQFEQAFEDEMFGPSPEESVELEETTDESLGFDETAVNPDDHTDVDDWEKDVTEEEKPEETSSEDFMTQYLRAHGIDRNKVRIANENGEIEEISFDDLSDEDKLAVLDGANELPISDEEIQTINYLRTNRMNLRDFAEWQKQEAIKQYLEQNQDITYTVDKLTDEELYKFDILDRYPNMTEEEANQEVENAKSNEELFSKKVQALREEYTRLEQEQNQNQAKEAELQKEQQFNEMANTIVNVARNTEELHGLEIDDQDKEEVLSLLLDRDANGQSEFYKLFEDPETLFKIAWYVRFGDEAFTKVNDYYKGIIEKSRRSSTPSNNQVKTVNRKRPSSNEPDPYGLNEVFK